MTMKLRIHALMAAILLLKPRLSSFDRHCGVRNITPIPRFQKGGFALGTLLCVILSLQANAAPGEKLDIFTFLRTKLAPHTAKCYEVEFLEASPSPQGKILAPAVLSWTTSGVWYKNDLLLADMSRGPLARLSLDESNDRVSPVTSVKGLQYSRENGLEVSNQKEDLGVAWFVHPRHGGYLLGKYDYELVGGRNRTVSKILFVNDNGEVEERLQPMLRAGIDTSRGEEVVSGGVHRMIPMNDGVFMVGGVKPRWDENSDDYWTAFAYLDRETYKPFNIKLHGTESMRELGNKYYSRDFMLMTRFTEPAGEDVALVLVMERSPWIGKVRETDTRILPWIDLSQEYTIPAFESEEAFSSQSAAMRFYRDLYQFVESEGMPIGLYSFNNRPFLVIKSPMSRTGTTAWHVREISVETGRLKDTIELPTSAAHIALVEAGTPNGAHFVIEKGPISINRGHDLPDLLHRSIRSGLMLDSAWFDYRDDTVQRNQTCQDLPTKP